MATIVNRFGTWYFQATDGKRMTLRTKSKKIAEEFFEKYKKVEERKHIIGMLENLIKSEFRSHGVTGVVYFIKSTLTGLIKVGHSKDIERRLKDLQIGSSSKLVLIGKIMGNRNTEKYIHLKLNNSRLHGEWFKPSEEMMQLINLFGFKEEENNVIDFSSDPQIEQAINSFEKFQKKKINDGR